MPIPSWPDRLPGIVNRAAPLKDREENRNRGSPASESVLSTVLDVGLELLVFLLDLQAFVCQVKCGQNRQVGQGAGGKGPLQVPELLVHLARYGLQAVRRMLPFKVKVRPKISTKTGFGS